MTGKEIYPLVYLIVKRAQKENQTLQNYTKYFDWSKRIPLPENTSGELADALCTSISLSQGFGLEIYFQEKIYLHDLENTNLLNQLKYLFPDNSSIDENYVLLGEIIRSAFEGRMVTNELDKELLNTI